jgi:hypothetical protein
MHAMMINTHITERKKDKKKKKENNFNFEKEY